MEKNNASCERNLRVVADIVLDMAKSGIVSFVDEQPHCVSPLGLVTKETSSGIKHRLIFDASRCINLHITPPSVKLSYLQRALEITLVNDFQTVFDLKSAYYHVMIAPEFRTYLGASITIEGSPRFFVYNYLPFGLNSAVHCITKIFKPFIAHVQSLGIRMSIYIDDGRILSCSKDQAELDRVTVYDLLRKAGWVLESDKSDSAFDSCQVKKYLGFLVDSQKMFVTAPVDKLQDISEFLVPLLNLHSVPVKTLAKALGLVIALIPSHGALARICTRSGYVDLERHVEQPGWKGLVEMSDQAVMELRFFVAHIMDLNGSPISTSLTSVRIDSMLPGAVSKTSWIPALRHDASTKIVSDSSAFKAAVLVLENTNPLLENLALAFNFDDFERSQSSGYRELLAVLTALRHFKHLGIHRANILWMTDSANVYSFLTKGSSKVHLQKLIFECAMLTHELECYLDPIHLLREDPRIVLADSASKKLDTDNWSVDVESFESLHRDFHFEIDLFADKFNKKVERYVSLYYDDTAFAVDAFSIPWDLLSWVCPPVSLLPKVIHRICCDPCATT
jgi:hypothetical protein